MKKRILSDGMIRFFHQHLLQEEKSAATVEKYLRNVRMFFRYAADREITKELTIAYKQQLQESGYVIRSINSMLASVNGFLSFLNWSDCRVKSLRQQKQTYCAEEKELTRAEYIRLLTAAKQKPRLQLVLQTICATGIRVSELRYFTVEGVRQGKLVVACKGKIRTILLPQKQSGFFHFIISRQAMHRISAKIKKIFWNLPVGSRKARMGIFYKMEPDALYKIPP